MNKRNLDLKVGELLRIALLMEHGGFIFKVNQVLFKETNFDWISSYLNTEKVN